jgi:hypothetical protein
MDINFSAEDLAFRDEVRDFFATEFDEETAQRLSGVQSADYKPAIVSWQKSMAAQVGARPKNLFMKLSAAPRVFPMWCHSV